MWSLCFLLLLFPHFGLLGALISTLLVEVILVILGFYWTRDYVAFEELKLDLKFLEPCLRFGFALYLAWFLSNIWQRLGNVLIDYITGDARAVASFDLANQGFLVVISITVMVISSLIPMFSKFLLAGKEGKIAEWSSRLVRYVLILNMLAFAAVLFLGSELIPLLIGQEYADVFPNTVVLLLGLFPSVFVQIGFVYAILYKTPGRYFRALIGSVAVFVVLAVALIPGYSAMGCSIATALSYYVMAVIAIWPFRERVGALLREGGVVVGLGAFVFPMALWKGEVLTNVLLAAGFSCAYLLALFGTRVVSVREVREAWQALRGNAA
jgi:O-antigen/teichoic acid export membrane protein